MLKILRFTIGLQRYNDFGTIEGKCTILRRIHLQHFMVKWWIHCSKTPKSRIFKCDPSTFLSVKHKKLWHCYFLQIWFWKLPDIKLAQITNFLQKCQIQIISEVHRWTSNFLTILKSTHPIWIVFARIRTGSIF